MADRIAVGDNLYLFRSSTVNNSCVISAHAGYSIKLPVVGVLYKLGMFQLPADSTLHYYVQPEQPFVSGRHSSPLLTRFQGSATRVGSQPFHEVVHGPEPVQDTYLAKFQEQDKPARSGEDDLTYDDVMSFMRQQDMVLRTNAGSGGAGYATVSNRQADVLTIRNRWWSTGVTLKSVVAQLHDQYKYRNFHCLFCRSE